jgi:hypothetical protein
VRSRTPTSDASRTSLKVPVSAFGWKWSFDQRCDLPELV